MGETNKVIKHLQYFLNLDLQSLLVNRNLSMIKRLFLPLLIFISLVSYSQNCKPSKGWVYCPQGSYRSLREDCGIVKEFDISISPFFISNEITNKEFRKFYNDIKQTPNDTIYWIDLKKAADKNRKHSTYIRMAIHKDIFPNLIDQSVWMQNPAIKERFFNSKYNNYPVIGVTYEGARLYCIWRTVNENRILEKKGKPLNMDYRIPMESEWEYAATFKQNGSEKFLKELHNVKRGLKNKIGIKNLENNVAEWTASYNKPDGSSGAVRGGSYKSVNSLKLRELVDKNKSKDYIGFRIVRTYSDFR